MRLKLLFSITLLLNALFSYALTWDEPWHDKVVKESENFVLGKVRSSNGRQVTVDILKTLGGKTLTGEIVIRKFYLLSICSRTGDQRPEFEFGSGDSVYFFLKKINDTFGIATPTTGFAVLSEGKVAATYRHSYHQAAIAPDVYEKTMTAIFQHYHGQPYDAAYINTYIKQNLSKKPAGFSAEEIDNFFGQHVALETIYHLRLGGYYAELLPFLQDTLNFHNQVSAARALTAYNTPACKELLLSTIMEKERRGFVKVMCIWAMSAWKPVDLKARLSETEKNVADSDDGFGGNIMDHRVCTHLPSVKDALKELIEEL